MESYEYSGDLWSYILPDGNSFCHWGGKAISYKILELLDLKEGERVCDLCCGEGGTLTLINKPLEIYGVDISSSALRKASQNLNGKNFHLVQNDVRKIPFDDNFFDKIYSQDPDVFLYPNKLETIGEISRVLKKEGIFVLQTYCATSNLTQEEKEKTERVLKNIGYPSVDIINLDELISMLKICGFNIKMVKDIHKIYLEDNLKMIRNLEKNWLKIKDKKIKDLLYWEKYLFSKKAWIGIIIVAKNKRN